MSFGVDILWFAASSSLVCCFFFFVLLPNVVYLLITEIINGIMLIVINRCLIWIAGLGVQLYCCMLDSIISFKCLNNPDCCWKKCPSSKQCCQFSRFRSPESLSCSTFPKSPLQDAEGMAVKTVPPPSSLPFRWKHPCFSADLCWHRRPRNAPLSKQDKLYI